MNYLYKTTKKSENNSFLNNNIFNLLYNKIYYYIITLFPILLLIIFFSGCTNSTHHDKPEAIKGVLDLRNWNFIKDGNLALDGEWEFYWEQLLSLDSIESVHQTADEIKYFRIPDIWNNYWLNGKKLDNFGYATYYLKILLDENTPQDLSLKLDTMGTAYLLFIDGKLIAENGKVGRSRKEMSPYYLPMIKTFNIEGNLSVDVVIHVSNYFNKSGGLWSSIILGTTSQIREKRERKLSFEIFLFSSLIVSGLFHLLIFIVRRNDKSSLYFGLLCIIIGIRAIFTGEKYFIHLFPNIIFEITSKIEFLTIPFGLILFAMYFKYNFQNKQSIILTRIILIVSFSFTLIIGIFPSYIYMNIWIYFIILLVIFIVFFNIVAFLEIRNKQTETIFFISGIILSSFAVFHDILATYNIISASFISPIGFNILLFIQSFLQSIKSSTAFNTVEKLLKELDIQNNKLKLLKKRLVDNLVGISTELEHPKPNYNLKKESLEIKENFLNQIQQILNSDNNKTIKLDDLINTKKMIYVIDTNSAIVYSSDLMKKLVEEITQAGNFKRPVLITGETGTGKELVAKAIHNTIKGNKGLFLPINCAAIPNTLWEEELFGHEKGSFTDAKENRQGCIAMAENGTLFFDEVGEIPLDIQAKLLRLLQENQYKQIGGVKLLKSNCRFVFSTNRDLEKMILNGTFREDLYYRINVFRIKTPSLRERKEDIIALLDYFFTKYSSEFELNIHEVEKEALFSLLNYQWLGNIRELENMVIRMLSIIYSSGIKNNYILQTQDVSFIGAGSEEIPSKKIVENRSFYNESDFHSIDATNLKESIEQYEKNVIQKVYNGCGKSQIKTADILQISRGALQYKLTKYNIK